MHRPADTTTSHNKNACDTPIHDESRGTGEYVSHLMLILSYKTPLNKSPDSHFFPSGFVLKDISSLTVGYSLNYDTVKLHADISNETLIMAGGQNKTRPEQANRSVLQISRDTVQQRYSYHIRVEKNTEYTSGHPSPPQKKKLRTAENSTFDTLIWKALPRNKIKQNRIGQVNVSQGKKGVACPHYFLLDTAFMPARPISFISHTQSTIAS